MNASMRPAHVQARRHELLADVAEKTADRLIKEHGLDPDRACDIGNDLADFLADTWKGQNIYFVADQGFKNSERDWAIWRELKTGNAHELGKKHGISWVRVHQIAKRCQREYIATVQNNLFPDPLEPAPGK